MAKVLEQVRMYLDTGPVAPYCTHLYLLEVELVKPREAEDWVQVVVSHEKLILSISHPGLPEGQPVW